MKKSVLMLFFASVIFRMYGQQIINPGFEMPSSGGQLEFNEWEYDQISQTETVIKNLPLKLDSVISYSGKYSVCISSRETGIWVVRQKIPVNANNCEKYVLSAWIKTDSVKGTVRIHARENGKDGKSLFNSTIQTIPGTSDWNRYSVSFYLDETINEILLGGFLSGTGKIWMDDFTLSPYEDDISNSAEAITYITDLLRIIKTNSIRKDSVDLSALESHCLKNLKGTKTVTDCYPMIKYLLYKLGDNHSRFLPPVQANRYKSNTALSQSSGKMIRKKVAYLSVPPVSSMDSASLVDFASNLQDLIKKLDILEPQGWIVDLRTNTGGNCYPMIAGLGPLIGEGIAMHWLDASNKWATISYKNGCSLLNDTIMVRAKDQPYSLRKTYPIAVLIGPLTASSGEIVAISFIGKPNCKFFGEQTYGLTTANDDFRLSDGSMLFLTSGTDADRNLKLYGGKLQPDLKVPFTDQIYTEDSDPVINSAIDWLLKSK